MQHDRIQNTPGDPHARVVASHDVSHRHIRLDCAGVCSSVQLRSVPGHTSILNRPRKTLLAMGFQRETASRGTLAMYTSVCLLVTVFVFHVRNV
jgi:hypothetical protein